MIAGEVLVFALLVAVAIFVLAPLLRKDAAEAERVGAAISEVRDLRSKREMLLASLRDLEEDHAAGKLDEPDYVELKHRLSSEAVAIMKQLDALDEAERKGGPVAVPASARRPRRGSPA